jgi:outer membrane receptor protein involved in Fe transport
MQKHIRWSLLLMLLVAFTGQVFAQATASASIDGTVLDQSKAVVPDAKVTITNLGTGATRTSTTNSNGFFRFDLLPVGTYDVKVAKAGFATASAPKIELQIGRTATVDLGLKPGSTSETVEVTGAVPLVDELKTDVSANITPTEVQEMPMIGRDVANLAYLAPGVKAADSYDPTKNRMAILSVNGQGGRNVNVTVNGVDNKDNTVGGPVMQLPLEAVQEFAISTQRFSAANGRSEGAAINMITKQGTNQYHGSIFGFFRDQALQADRKFPDGSTSHPPYSRQQFGGSIGGPIVKDRLFTFFAYERQRENQSIAEDPIAFQELTIAKNAGLAADPAATVPTPFYENRYNGRLDLTLNDRNTLYGSFNFQANNSLNDQSPGTFDLTAGNFTLNHMALANLTWNSVLSNTTVNQFTFGYQYWNNLIATNVVAPDVTFPYGANLTSFGTNTNVPQQSYQKKWQFKDDLTKTVGRHTFKTGVDYMYGPSLGGFFEFNTPIEYDFGALPSCIMSQVTVLDPITNAPVCGPGAYPQQFATPGALVGISASIGDPRTDVPGGTKQFGVYFQDDWKVSHRLTLDLGLRWDKDFNMIGGAAVQNSRTFQELQAAAAFNPYLADYVKTQPHDDNKNFSPRIGFAYDLTGAGRYVVRGGYGLYYGDVFQNIPIFMEQQHNATIFQTVLSLSSPGDPVPGTGQTLGTYRFGVDPTPTFAASPELVDGSVGRVINPDYRNPLAEEFNIGSSMQVSRNSVFEVEYTHVLSLHENKTINIDQKVCSDDGAGGVSCVRPFTPAFTSAGVPVLNSVREEASIGRSIYDGINFSYRQQMVHHFSMQANYTLSWARGWGSGGGSFRNYPALSTEPFAPYEFGYTPNDERHHITISGIVALPFGIQFAPILQFGTARPYNVDNGSTNTLNTGGGTLAGAVVVPISDPTNYTAFANNDAGAQVCFYVSKQCTIAKYDSMRGDPFFELDTRLTKSFKFGERRELQIIAQAFNLTNRANYGNNFDATITSPTFGKASNFINPSSTTIPRSVTGEFGVRFTF